MPLSLLPPSAGRSRSNFLLHRWWWQRCSRSSCICGYLIFLSWRLSFQMGWSIRQGLVHELFLRRSILRQIWKNARTLFNGNVYFERDGLMKGRSSFVNRSIKSICRYYKTILAISRIGVNLLSIFRQSPSVTNSRTSGKAVAPGGPCFLLFRRCGTPGCRPISIMMKVFYKMDLPILTEMESGVYHVTLPFDSVWQCWKNSGPKWPGFIIIINNPQKNFIHLKVKMKQKKWLKHIITIC